MPPSPSTDPSSLIGRRLGHYEIVSPLGAGGMGEVYLAQDTRLHRRVALKLLPESLTSDREAATRFLREARTAAALDHPNICAIHEVGEGGGRSFIVMQYVEGENLAAKLARQRPSCSESLALAQQIAEALAEAHAHQIIHRDIKPANVVVTPRGQAKVLDFGLAKTVRGEERVDTQIATASLLSTPGLVVGTAPYMSPEQVRGEPVDPRTDIWSFGVVLHELLTGRRPFEAKTSVEILSAILTLEPPALTGEAARSPHLERLVRRCLEKDRARRYQTMQEVLPDLDRARSEVERVDGEPSPDQPTAPVAPPPGSPATDSVPASGVRRSRLALALVAAAVVVVLVGAYSMLSRPDAPAPVAGGDRESAAYDDYLRGKVMVSEENPESNEAAIELLERAVASDPRLAPAFAALAVAYNNKSFYYAPDQAKQLSVDAQVAVEKALALDRNLADAHHARGLVLWTHANRFPHQQAIQSFRRALELDPDHDESHHRLGLIYVHVGLLEEARAEVERALAINPANTNARFRLGIVHLYRGRYEEALALLEGIPSTLNPTLVDRSLALTYLRLGRVEKAAAVIDQYLRSRAADQGGSATSTKAILLALSGKARDAEVAIERAIEIGRDYGHFHHTAHNIASAYALLGRPDDAFHWLEEAAADGFPCYPCYDTDAYLDSLRPDPRFRDFMSGLRKQQERYSAAP